MRGRLHLRADRARDTEHASGVQAGSAKDKVVGTGKDAYDSAASTGKQAYDATKGAAEDLAATLKSYLTWAQTRASELTKTSKDTTNVGPRTPCVPALLPDDARPFTSCLSSASGLDTTIHSVIGSSFLCPACEELTPGYSGVQCRHKVLRRCIWCAELHKDCEREGGQGQGCGLQAPKQEHRHGQERL